MYLIAALSLPQGVDTAWSAAADELLSLVGDLGDLQQSLIAVRAPPPAARDQRLAVWSCSGHRSNQATAPPLLVVGCRPYRRALWTA
jgi:hypothetical protein